MAGWMPWEPDGRDVERGHAHQRRRRADEVHETRGISEAEPVGWITRPAGPGARGASTGASVGGRLATLPELQVVLAV